MFEESTRVLLARFIEADDLASARSLLMERAQHYTALANKEEERYSRRAYDSRARWLMKVLADLGKVASIEASIRTERGSIKAIDTAVIEAMAKLRDYLARCAAMAAPLWAATAHHAYFIPAFHGRAIPTAYPYGTPLEYLEAFGKAPLSFAYKVVHGRPDTWDTFEKSGFDNWPFEHLLYAPDWGRYLEDSFGFFAQLLQWAAGESAPVELFAEVAAMQSEMDVAPFDLAIVAGLCQRIRESLQKRYALQEPIGRQLQQIHAYFEAVRRCEEGFGLSDLPYPNEPCWWPGFVPYPSFEPGV